MKLYTPRTYKDASARIRNRICNGTGSAGTPPVLVYFLDSFCGYGTDFREPSNCHDWMYHFGRKWHHKIWADVVFLYNMNVEIRRQQPVFKELASIRAIIYFVAVLLFGWRAFYS